MGLDIVSWLYDGTIFLPPNEKDPDDLGFSGNPTGVQGGCKNTLVVARLGDF